MRKWTVSSLAKQFNLSRSTLLYYDSIGLLSPDERSKAGYRIYSDRMRERLGRICAYREAGVPLKEIGRLLERGGGKGAAQKLLLERLDEIGKAIRLLRIQQRIALAMLEGGRANAEASLCDRERFVSVLEKAGLSGEDMRRFHEAFEGAAPDAHHDFLSMLGLRQEEISEVRKRSASVKGVSEKQ